ncbi:MAG: chemotaxis protein CheA [Melioribacter sp.]|uniref:chemotaxis protein CheA n=1 Tax=Rosettibacter primus TaxID=3111523 RepID=UPI00247B4376|nr:chemotaxis protein CheA [Melioribacter sp.]
MEGTTQNPMLIDPEMKEIVDSFLLETKEILENLNVDLIELEKRPDDLDLLNQIFRSFHTIKGTSGFLGLEKLPAVTHKCEDILNKLRKGEAKLNSNLMDGIILGYDTIKELLIKIENEKNEDVDVENVIKVLAGLLESMGNNPAGDIQIETHVQTTSQIEANQPNIESVNTTVKEKNAAAKLSSTAESKKTDNTIRVEVERLDALLNIASELVLGRNRLMQVNSQVALEFENSNIAKDLADATKQIDLMTSELQLVVMKLRMIKIGKVFNRFPRVVRDLCKELEKEVELKIYGEDTEVDKNLIEEINDPLVHLVRNAIDHGIEKPDVRLAKGKNRKGTVILSAEHEGNNIVIKIEDDGKGIDPEVIKEKAISKGFITAERAKELSKQEAYNLIFHPGFSTAEVVTNVSGRGVGMDVVKTNVAKLRGTISVESEVDKGTKIILRLPLTLAIISGMIVKACNQTLVIPLHSVIEVIRVNRNQIETVRGKEVINLRDSILPIIGLEELIDNRENGHKKETQWQYIVEVGVAEKRFGIKVDDLVGQQEVVIKSLGNYLGKIDGIAGSTIMGDGTVVIILDINELFNKLEKKINA